MEKEEYFDFHEIKKTWAVVRGYGLCAWFACHLPYIFPVIQTHAYSNPHAPYTVFRVGRITFFLVNRVRNQNDSKRPQSVGRLALFWFFTRCLADSGTDYNPHSFEVRGSEQFTIKV